jgi:predicted acetyltransferase
MKLVKPSMEYKDSFLKGAAEISAEGYRSFLKAFVDENNFQQYCDTVNNLSMGIGLKHGKVSETSFWLIDDDGNFVGHTSIRHELSDTLLSFGGHIGYIIVPSYRGKGYGKKILELCLFEALRIGLPRVLMTCDSSNAASARIIEKNGGIFENEMRSDTRNPWRRYWIELKHQ